MSDSPGFKRLKKHPRYEAMVKRTLELQQQAISEVHQPSKEEVRRADGYPEATKTPRKK